MEPEISVLKLGYGAGEGNKETEEPGIVTRRCVRNRARNRARFRLLYRSPGKEQNKLSKEGALRPPIRIHIAVRKYSLETTQQDPSTYENRRRFSRRTPVVRKGGVMAAERGHSSLQR